MNKPCTKGLEIHNFLLPRPSRHSKILRHGHPVPSENVVQYLANLQNPRRKMPSNPPYRMTSPMDMNGTLRKKVCCLEHC